MNLRKFFILNCLFLICNFCFAQSNLARRIDSLFTSYLDSSFSGCVLVAEKNKITLKKGYGFANNITRQPNTPKTLFNVASIGKLFTAYSILLLEKRGLLNTNDLLSKYTGPFNDIRDSVTIHHLLLHSSGVFKEDADVDYSTRAKFIQSVKNNPPEAKPGEKYRYSNAGYSMLAAVVEIVSGQPFENFLLQNVFKPLKMQNTGYPWEQRMNKKLFATGYNSKHEPQPPQQDVWATRGPGHLLTNVEDLYKWVQGFENKKFMPRDIRNKLLHDYIPGKETYSWDKAVTSRNTRFYHKGGGRSDFENRLMWYPDDQVLIIFLLNNDYNLARIFFSKIRTMMN